jgi:hypothetical protein
MVKRIKDRADVIDALKSGNTIKVTNKETRNTFQFRARKRNLSGNESYWIDIFIKGNFQYLGILEKLENKNWEFRVTKESYDVNMAQSAFEWLINFVQDESIKWPEKLRVSRLPKSDEVPQQKNRPWLAKPRKRTW